MLDEDDSDYKVEEEQPMAVDANIWDDEENLPGQEAAQESAEEELAEEEGEAELSQKTEEQGQQD